jgi:hypothetical protein
VLADALEEGGYVHDGDPGYLGRLRDLSVRHVALPAHPELQDGDWHEAFAAAGEPGGSGSISLNVTGVPPGADVSLAPFARWAVAEVLAHGEDYGDYAETDVEVVGRLWDGRWFYITAGCDTTGWDCVASGSCVVAATREDIVRFGLSGPSRVELGLALPDLDADLLAATGRPAEGDPDWT